MATILPQPSTSEMSISFWPRLGPGPEAEPKPAWRGSSVWLMNPNPLCAPQRPQTPLFLPYHQLSITDTVLHLFIKHKMASLFSAPLRRAVAGPSSLANAAAARRGIASSATRQLAAVQDSHSAQANDQGPTKAKHMKDFKIYRWVSSGTMNWHKVLRKKLPIARVMVADI